MKLYFFFRKQIKDVFGILEGVNEKLTNAKKAIDKVDKKLTNADKATLDRLTKIDKGIVENVILLVTFPKLTHNSLNINNLFPVTRIHLTRTFGSPMCSQTLITTLT